MQAALVQPVIEQRVAQCRIKRQPTGNFQAVIGPVTQGIQCCQPLRLQRVRCRAAERRAVHDRLRRLRPVLQHTRQDVVAQPVAGEMDVAIGRIINTRQLPGGDVIE